MNPILLTPFDIAIAAVLIVVDGVLSIVLRLGLHRRLAWAATRMVVQLVLIGYVLRIVWRRGPNSGSAGSATMPSAPRRSPSPRS
jgi:ABC-type iron transport system FetAB permease component